MITAIYRVSVTINDDVYRKFAESKEYKQKSCDATQGNIRAGISINFEIEEWAEFNTLEDAELCEKRLMDMDYYFFKLLIQK